jgi:hypothetical protein
MSLASVILAFCGFAVVLWLLHENDYRAVLRIVAGVGGGLAIVVLIRGTIIATCGLAWWSLLRSVAPVRLDTRPKEQGGNPATKEQFDGGIAPA